MKSLITHIFTILFSLIALSSLAFATDDVEAKIRKELPYLLGSSNQGTEFFMTFHPCFETASEGYGCIIYISSAVATRVTIEIPSKGIYQQRTTLANGIIKITLNPAVALCYRKADYEPPQPQKVFKGYGIKVTAEDPIVCYGLIRYQYSSDGYLAIPTNCLGKNYVVSSYNDANLESNKNYLTSYTSIIGIYDRTNVQVTLGGRSSNLTPGANPMKTGEKRTERLYKSDVWLIGTIGDYNDLTGTTVQASKPVAVISGSFCAYVPINISSCNYLIEQDLPMENWGYRYNVSPLIKRKKASIIRVLASEPNTLIYRDGNEWSLVKSVGGVEGTGYIESRVVGDEEQPRPVTISSKNRIAVTQYNCGQGDDNIESAPFQMAIIPTEQYKKDCIWLTPGASGEPPFKENYVNLCYKSTESGNIPDDLEFGSVSNGMLSWKKLNTVVDNPGQPFVDESITDSRKYRSLTIKLEKPGNVYSLRGSEGMAGYCYGFDYNDSYGFTVISGSSNLTKPDIWKPAVTYMIDCEGHVQGNVIEQPENDETSRSNMASISIDYTQSYNFNLVYDDFVVGETYNVNWSLDVIDAEADGQAVLTFCDRAGNDTTLIIKYMSTRLETTNKIENWGSKAYNDITETKELSLINESLKPVVVDSIILISKDFNYEWEYNGFIIDSSIYKENGGVLPKYTLPPGEELKFKVSFNPQSLLKDIANGKIIFTDSIRVKAEWQPESSSYCYQKTLGEVKAEITSVSVENLSGLTGIFGIFPNPVTKKEVTINYSIKYDGLVLMSLYDLNGILIKDIVNTYQISGCHIVSIPIEGLAQGTYFIKFKAGDVIKQSGFTIAK